MHRLNRRLVLLEHRAGIRGGKPTKIPVVALQFLLEAADAEDAGIPIDPCYAERERAFLRDYGHVWAECLARADGSGEDDA